MRYFIACLLLLFPTSSAFAQDQNTAGPRPSYRLRPGDVLVITVWGQEAYSGRFKVDETGRVPYPVVGEIDTRDKTMTQIREEIRAGLQRIFNDPFVTVTPQFSIAVLGEVRNPGLFPVDPTLTVLDIVAMAGGPSRNGNINKIQLLRGGADLGSAIRTGPRRRSHAAAGRTALGRSDHDSPARLHRRRPADVADRRPDWVVRSDTHQREQVTDRLKVPGALIRLDSRPRNT